MDPNTGAIRALKDTDMVMFGVPMTTAAEAMQAVAK
jgi:prephenate dehydrogenase